MIRNKRNWLAKLKKRKISKTVRYKELNRLLGVNRRRQASESNQDVKMESY